MDVDENKSLIETEKTLETKIICMSVTMQRHVSI
jgi:hypothetical protein